MSYDSRLTASLYAQIKKVSEKLGVPRLIVENELMAFKHKELNFGKIRVDLDNPKEPYFSFSVIGALHCNPYTGRPYKGGMRIHHTAVTPDILRALAIGMTFKCGVIDVEFGGAKFGVPLPRPASFYSTSEMHRIIEAIADRLIRKEKIISPRYYVPATDIGSTSWHMDIIDNKFWDVSEGGREGAPVTGRSVENGGLKIREESTALGGMFVLEQLMAEGALPALKDNAEIIVQGLGQVGRNFIRIAKDRGYKIVGVSNISGAVYNPLGIEIEALPQNPNGPLGNLEGEHCDNNELLAKKCDILVPAAIESVITPKIARGIKAKIILELANHPVTEDAYPILSTKGIAISPDILTNAGGVAISYWEWSLSFSHPRHAIERQETEDIVRAHLKKQMEEAASQVVEFAKHYDVNLREAAWLKAVDKVSKALIKKQGGRWNLGV